MYVAYAVATFVTVFSLMMLVVEPEEPPRAAPSMHPPQSNDRTGASAMPAAQPPAAPQTQRTRSDDPVAALAKPEIKRPALTPNQPTLNDDQVRDRMIAESISRYSGPCACPYNMMRNGRPCDTRSAYSKPGGAGPLCYRRDISDAMVRTWRARLQSR